MKKQTLALAFVLVSAACANPAMKIREQDNMLTSAGFQRKVADTPTRQASLKKLPANEFVIRKANGQPVYLYADPVVCDCLYTGSEKAWDAYQRKKVDKGIAAAQQQTRYVDDRLMLDSDYNDWNLPPPTY